MTLYNDHASISLYACKYTSASPFGPEIEYCKEASPLAPDV